jgi:antitoxin MazE
MNVTVRKIGNSRGVIIPAAMLAACNIKDSVDVALEGGSLVLRPASEPRKGWFDDYASTDEEVSEVRDWDGIPADEAADEWTW